MKLNKQTQFLLNYTELNAEIVPKNETPNRNNPYLKIEIKIRTLIAEIRKQENKIEKHESKLTLPAKLNEIKQN